VSSNLVVSGFAMYYKVVERNGYTLGNSVDSHATSTGDPQMPTYILTLKNKPIVVYINDNPPASTNTAMPSLAT
jgi:hypothetical protein